MKETSIFLQEKPENNITTKKIKTIKKFNKQLNKEKLQEKNSLAYIFIKWKQDNIVLFLTENEEKTKDFGLLFVNEKKTA